MVLGPVENQGTAVGFVGVQQVGIGERSGAENTPGLGFGGGIDDHSAELIKGTVFGIAVLEVGKLPLVGAVEDRNRIVHIGAVIGALAVDRGTGGFAVRGMGLVITVFALAAEDWLVDLGTGDRKPGDEVGVESLEGGEVGRRAGFYAFCGLGEGVGLGGAGGEKKQQS